MFTGVGYGSLDFNLFDAYFRKRYPYADTRFNGVAGMGATWYVGNSAQDAVKVDIFYTDPFVWDIIDSHGIRLASPQEIIAKKLDIIGSQKGFLGSSSFT